MRYFVYLAVFVIISCSGTKGDANQKSKFITDSLKGDSLLIVLKTQDSIMGLKNAQIHALKDTLFLDKARLADVKKYLNICKRNPSQEKFFRGWVARAI